MKKLFVVVLLALSAAAHAGVPEVLAAEEAVIVAKERVAALKKALTKTEKAQLAVALATSKLAKLEAK